MLALLYSYLVKDDNTNISARKYYKFSAGNFIISDRHKVWIKAAFNDLETAIYLHQGGFWFQATLSAQQVGEKFGKLY